MLSSEDSFLSTQRQSQSLLRNSYNDLAADPFRHTPGTQQYSISTSSSSRFDYPPVPSSTITSNNSLQPKPSNVPSPTQTPSSASPFLEPEPQGRFYVMNPDNHSSLSRATSIASNYDTQHQNLPPLDGQHNQDQHYHSSLGPIDQDQHASTTFASSSSLPRNTNFLPLQSDYTGGSGNTRNNEKYQASRREDEEDRRRENTRVIHAQDGGRLDGIEVEELPPMYSSLQGRQ
jgi:hypothetical protein